MTRVGEHVVDAEHAEHPLACGARLVGLSQWPMAPKIARRSKIAIAASEAHLPHKCKYCQKPFPTISALQRHVARKEFCRSQSLKLSFAPARRPLADISASGSAQPASSATAAAGLPSPGRAHLRASQPVSPPPKDQVEADPLPELEPLSPDPSVPGR